MDKNSEIAIIRILKRLHGRTVSIETKNAQKFSLKDNRTNTHILKITPNQLSLLASRGLIKRRGSDIELTKDALMHLKRRECIDTPFEFFGCHFLLHPF